MPKLKATPHMMRLASEDKPTTTNSWGHTYSQYKRLGYTRCCIKNGILKLAIFFTEPMRMGGNLPAYELYFDRDKKQYITYDCQSNRWLTASIFRLNMPSYAYYATTKLWFSRETNKAIRRYFNTDRDGVLAISKFQEDILAEKLKMRHKKETEPWDEDLKQTPELPKDWINWVSKVGIPEHFIFYHYSRNKKGQTGYCTHCCKDVPIKNPKYNKQGHCPCCRTPITYKSVGKCGRVNTSYYTAHLIQRCKDGVILREFCVHRTHPKNSHTDPDIHAFENRRIICDKSGMPQRAYYYGDYKHVAFRWIACGLASISRSYFYHSFDGKLYGKTMPNLAKNELKKTGITEYYRRKGFVEPERYLQAVNEYPYLEKIAKVGLTTLFDELIESRWYGDDSFLNTTQTSLTKLLCIDAQQLKRMRTCNSGRKLLSWLQYEKVSGKRIPDKVLSSMCKYGVLPKDLKFIRDKMSIEQIYNYIHRHMRDEGMNLKEVLTTWSDYLSMARRLNLDTDDEIIYRVRKLKQRHDELVEICNSKEDAIRAGEILEMYPNIEKVLSELKEKYEFSDEKYSIIVPEKIEDILLEGRTLHHCVGNDRYWERIATNESYVMFLRQTQKPDKAYYTLEVEPGGTIRQKRTMYDRQHEDIEAASLFLRKWQLEISKRMTEKDQSLAKQSKILRLAEFSQMDKNNVLINTGLLQGQRLVDVLMADLMEVAA